MHAGIVDARSVVTVCAYEEDNLVGRAHLQVTVAQFARRIDKAPGVTGRWSAMIPCGTRSLGDAVLYASSVRDELRGWKKVSKKYRRRGE